MIRDDGFYNSKRWKRLRKAVLQRDGYECQMAKAQGRSEEAKVVHHIFPRSEYPEYQWEDWNLISLSLGAHNMMHIRETDKLTERGELLRKNVAEERGIGTRKRTTVVIGMPGTGKTTYVKKNMNRGVVYDLDAIAGALRLQPPKKETYKPARWIANSLARGFTEAAHQYVNDVWMIRTAPTIEEIIEMDPSELVVIYGQYGDKTLTDDRRATLAGRIRDAVKWAKANGVNVKEIDA